MAEEKKLTTEPKEEKKEETYFGEYVEFIVFKVGEEEYGLEIEKVQEVIRIKEIKKIPRAPRFILGVMNLRGNIIPVVGLREKFGLPPIETNKFTRIIVVNHKKKLIGMLVDKVNEVVRVPVENIEGNPDILTEESTAIIRGVAKAGERVLILLELDYLLYTPEEIHIFLQKEEGKELSSSSSS